MSQATTWGVPSTGPVTPTDYAARDNAAFNALLSSHSGANEPAYKTRGTLWEDTTTNTLKRWDGTAWRVIDGALPDTRTLGKIVSPSGIGTAIFTIPAETSILRISGRYQTATLGGPLSARFSFDNGATYLSSAGSHAFGQVLNDGSSWFATPNGSADNALLSTGSTALMAAFEANVFLAKPGSTDAPLVMARAMNYNANGRVLLFRDTHVSNGARPTHMMLFSSSNWKDTTEIFIEERLR